MTSPPRYPCVTVVSVERYSTESLVRVMNASSREACWTVSSKMGIWFCQAMVPMCSAVRPSTPSTSGWPVSVVTVMSGPSSRSRSRAASGVRTVTEWFEARATNSSTVVSAISRPRPMTTRRVAVWAISLIRWEDTKTVWPSAARSLSMVRIHRTPSGSRPLTGSSRTTVCGLPSSADATPRRWPMPRENPPTRLPATSCSPTMSITSSTRRAVMPLVWARASRWLRADRPVCTALASSSTPSSAIGAAADR